MKWAGYATGGSWDCIVRGWLELAEVAAAQGQAERAGRLFGVADRLLLSASISRDDLNRRVAEARAHLDATAFTTGWTAGQTMTEEQAVSDTLQEAWRTVSLLVHTIYVTWNWGLWYHWNIKRTWRGHADIHRSRIHRVVPLPCAC